MNVQEELLQYPWDQRWQRRGQNVNVLRKSFYVMAKALSGKLSCVRTGLVET